MFEHFRLAVCLLRICWCSPLACVTRQWKWSRRSVH